MELEEFASTPITNPSGVIWTTIDSSGVAGEYIDYKKKKRGVKKCLRRWAELMAGGEVIFQILEIYRPQSYIQLGKYPEP